jgi:hypothetical protein
MSDALNIHDQLKFKSKISFTSESCLNYIRRQNSNEVILTLIIPVEILVKWNKIIKSKKFPVSLVDLLYISQGLPGCCLKPEATDRIERRLKELCSVASKSCVGISGNNRVKKLKQVKKLAIHCHEVEDPNELPRRIASLEEEKAKLQEQVDSLEAKCESLVEEVLEFTQDRRRITELEQSVENVNDENEALQAYTVYKPFWKETVANTVIPLMQTKGLLMIVSVKPKSKGN